MYLVDTNVLPAGASTWAVSVVTLINWMDRNSASLYLSVITIAAIEDGIAKNRWDGASRKAQRLSEWLEVDLHTYAVKVLLIDLAVARHIGSLSNLGRGQGRAPGFVDLAIAALAQRHG